MNKWGFLGIIASIITILGFLGYQQIDQLIPQLHINGSTPANGNTLGIPNRSLILPDFDFSKISSSIIPVRNYFYKNSNNIICSKFTNPNNITTDNFTLIGEWFLGGNKEPSYVYDENLSYGDIFNGNRINWFFVNNSTEGDIIKFRLALQSSLKNIQYETNYSLITNDSLEPYLENEDNGLIKWDNNMIQGMIKNTTLCGVQDDFQIAKNILNFTRNWMNRPSLTKDILYYDSTKIDSLNSSISRIGTSQQYSSVYVALLRAVGIPSKVDVNYIDGDIYYFAEFYYNRQWIPVDVYGNYNNFGSCFEVNNIEVGDKSTNICFSGLDKYIEFSEITPTINYVDFPEIIGIMKNNYNKDIASNCVKVNVSYYDNQGNLINDDNDTYIFGDNLNTLKVNSSESLDFSTPKVINYSSVKITLNNFFSLC